MEVGKRNQIEKNNFQKWWALHKCIMICLCRQMELVQLCTWGFCFVFKLGRCSIIMASHFPQLIIIIKNSKIAPKVQTTFYFQTLCWLVYISESLLNISALFFSKLLIFLIPSNLGQGKGEVRTIFQNFENGSNCPTFR